MFQIKKPAQKWTGFIEIDPATTYFPTPERCSIIGSSRLNYRVRDGNGCDPADTITGKLDRMIRKSFWIFKRSLTTEYIASTDQSRINRLVFIFSVHFSIVYALLFQKLLVNKFYGQALGQLVLVN